MFVGALFPNSAADALLDTDGDGMKNWQEYVAGTDPTNAQSYLKVDQLTVNGPASVRFQAVSNKTYTVQFKDSVTAAAWQKLSDVVARPSNRVEVVTDPDTGLSLLQRLSKTANGGIQMDVAWIYGFAKGNIKCAELVQEVA